MSSETPETPEVTEVTEEQEAISFWQKVPRNRWIFLAGAGFILVCVFGALLAFSTLRGKNEDSETGNENVTESRGNTPTPFVPTAVPPTRSAENESLVVGISDSSTITVALDAPMSLRLADQEYGVIPQTVGGDGSWQPETSGTNTAVWVYGTVINYVVAIPFSDANQALLSGLAPGEEMTLFTRNGNNFTFTFESRTMVPASSRDVYAQQRPGLTLILWGGEGDDRMVVTGQYKVPDVSSAGSDNTLVELGQTAQLDDLQITVSSASHLLVRQEAPPGFAFYLVDFEVQNVGLTAVDANSLRLLLIDELGNQYAVNPAAGQLGNFPSLNGFINAGQSIQASAGYQIPAGLDSKTLIWAASRGDRSGQLQVRIPFNEGGSQGASVTLTRAEVSSDFTSLILGGQVASLGNQPVNITEADVMLQTPDGSVFLLLSTNPPFPWVVAPGETVPFSVTFQRPSATDTATFTVLNQPFALSNFQ